MCGAPCQTNDSLVDNLLFQNEMHQAWLDSYGPEHEPLPPNQRDEKLIAVINDNGNYTTVNFEAQSVSSCHMSGVNYNLSGSQAQNLVALIHTHPFTPGQVIEDQRCLDARNYPPGSTYESAPSLFDHQALNFINYQLENNNLNSVPMIIMDTDNINKLQQTQTVENNENIDPENHFNSDTFNRCGY